MNMRSFFSILIVAIAAQIALHADAQEFDSSLPENVQRHMKYILGTWDYTYTQDGNEYAGVWTVTPVSSGVGVISEYQETGPTGPNSGNFIHGWNSKTERLVDNHIGVVGGIGVSTYELKSTVLAEGVGESTLPDGTKRTSKLRSEYSPDEIVWTNFETVIDGEPQEDRVFTFKRRKTPISIEKMQAFEPQIGTWVSTGKDGQSHTLTYRRINNDSYVEMIEGDFRIIIGWDFDEQAIVGWGFGTHGGQGKSIYQRSDAGWHGNSDWKDRWGKPANISFVSEVDGDTLTIKTTYNENTSERVWQRAK